MTDAQVTALVAELRTDYQLPPYLPDDTIRRAILRGEDRLTRLRPDADFEADKTARGLLADYCYYDIYHTPDDYMVHFGAAVRSWQFDAPTEGDADETESTAGGA